MKSLVLIFLGGSAVLIVLVAYGCGAVVETPTPTRMPEISFTAVPQSNSQSATAPTASPTIWLPPTALVGTPIPGAVATLTAAPPLQTGTLTITNSLGKKVPARVDIA